MATNGYSPTYREICKAVGIGSLSRVYIHLNELRDQGFIEFDYKKPRGISLPDRLIE